MKNHTFSNKIILRTPLKEVDTDITWEKIMGVFQQKLYREALFVASPNLYELLENYEIAPEKLEKDELTNLKISLYKYYSRFSNRCTPFGLYAYVSTLELAKESNIIINQQGIRKATKFDTFFLAKLLKFIEKTVEIRNALKYYPNSGLYAVNDKYRYVEYYFKEELRLHKISGVDRNEYLDTVIEKAQNGVLISELTDELTDENISSEQIIPFLHTLIDNQFLVSELGITLSGEDYLTRLINIFSEERFAFFEAQEILSLLHDLQQRLNSLENLDATVQDYLDLFEYVNHHFDKVPIKKLFQVDGYRDQKGSTLSYSVFKQLRSAVQVVNKLTSKRAETSLKHFAKKFAERYEENELPLTQALDPDIGINYAKNLGAKTPLIEHLNLNRNKNDLKIDWDKRKSAIFQKLLAVYQKGEFEMVLSDKDVNAFEENEQAYFDSFSVFFSAFSENNDDKLYLKTIWGPTAASLIGRFCHLDQSISDLSEEIYQKEKEQHADKLVAEIIHLPQARTGNVLHRSSQRQYEIPYLGNSSLPRDQQLPVSDLMVSVKFGKVKLRSKSLNKEIIPRLSNAHNYSADALPIYHFLCDLATQGSSPIGFSWGLLQYEYPYLPRVSFKNVVLSRARWAINPEEIKALKKNKGNITFLKDFLQKRKIPNVVSFVMGDNEVVINFSNDLSRNVFYSMIRNKGFVELKEFFFQEPSVSGNYANELIATAYKKVETKEKKYQVPGSAYKNEKIVKSFSIGDEWLYYKFYCGEKIAEKILTEGLLPIVTDLKSKNLIERWFFIRYHDSGGFHLRFRIKIVDKKYFASCINTIKYHIKTLERDGLIWKTQVDTYLRETERYGYYSIEAAEKIFNNDSDCTIQFANLIEGEEGERVRWLFALLSMDHLLQDFKLSLEQKVSILKMLKIGFGYEFKRKGLLNKQINDLYTSEGKNIEQFLDKENIAETYIPLWKLLAERSIQNKEAVNELYQLREQDKLPSSLGLGIIPSYLHMICNRLFLSKHRIHEMVVYDFLYKYYSKKMHLQKATKKPLVKSV